MPQIELSSGTIEYTDTSGGGPVIVLLHGPLMDATLPTRGAPSAASSWTTAPPVSLPISVTSSRPSRSRNSATSFAIPGSDRSAPAFMACRCAPSGGVGATQR